MLPGIRIQYVSIDIFIKLLHIKLNNYIMHEYNVIIYVFVIITLCK